MAYGKTKRERVEDEKAGSGTGFWRPQDGENRVRILPPWSADADAFWFRTGTHFNVGPDEKAVACPEESGVTDTCFLCRQAKRLSKGDEEERDEGEAISCRPAFLLNVVDYAHPDEGVQVWRCGITAFRQIRKLWLNDDEYGDMADLENGYDIIITKEGSGINTKYDVMPARSNSRFPTKKLLEHSSKAVAALYQTIADEEFELPNLADIQTFYSDEEMEAIYKGRSGRKERGEEEDKSSTRSRREEEPDDENEDDKKGDGKDEEPEERPRRRTREDDDDSKGEDDKKEPEERPRSRRARDDDDDDKGDSKFGSSRVRARVRDLG